MKGIFATFQTLFFAVLGILIAILADAAIKSVLPEYSDFRAGIDENPVLWLIASILVAFLLTYIGHKAVEEKLQELTDTCDRYSKRIRELEELLIGERRRRGVDPLTGLPNQFRFEIELDELISDENKKSQYTLIYIDLFGLKNVNDTQGDEFGSLYIQSCVNIIIDAMYRKEKMFRIGANAESSLSSAEIYRSREGGDEFFLLLRADEQGALFAIKRLLRDLINEKNNLIAVSQNPAMRPVEIRIGFRAGVVEFSDYENREAVVQEAKAAQLHTRLGDLPDAPSRYVVTGTPPRQLSEQSKKILIEIDSLIDGQS